MYAETCVLLDCVSVVLGSELHASLVGVIDMGDAELTVWSSSVLDKATSREGIFDIAKIICTSSLILDTSRYVDGVDEHLLSLAYQSTTCFSDWVESISSCIAISANALEVGSREEVRFGLGIRYRQICCSRSNRSIVVSGESKPNVSVSKPVIEAVVNATEGVPSVGTVCHVKPAPLGWYVN